MMSPTPRWARPPLKYIPFPSIAVLNFFFLHPSMFLTRKEHQNHKKQFQPETCWNVPPFENFVNVFVYHMQTNSSISHIGFLVGIIHSHTEGHKCHTHTHNSRPSQSYGPARDMGTYYNQTSAFQAPLYKILLMRPPCLTFGRLKPWWMENFLCKRFNLIIPAFRWATNSSARFYTIFHLPPLVWIPFTRNRGPGIHCRCNLRCKTKSSNQRSLSPWSNIEYLLVHLIFCSFFASMHANHCPPGVPIQQLNEAYGFSPLPSFWSWYEVKRQVIWPNTIVGMMTESKSFKRSLKDTCRFRSVSPCSLNFIQAIWLRCCISTMALFRRSPDNFLPKYLWFCSPCNTSILSPPIARNIGSFKLSVCQNFGPGSVQI